MKDGHFLIKEIKRKYNSNFQKKYPSLLCTLKIFLEFIFFLILILVFLIIYQIFKKIIFIKYNKFSDILPIISFDRKNSYPSLSELFNSRELFINDANLTLDYIHYIRPIDENKEEKYNQKLYPDLFPNLSFTENRTNQINLYTYYNICNEEKLISNKKINYSNNPIISVLVPSYNKRNMILKSIRSIQNQSLKNIEIIIVDDASTDNSSIIFK